MIAWDTPQFIILSLGCLVLALAAYRGERAGIKKTAVMALTWAAIIAGVTAIIALIQRSTSIGEAIGLTLL